MRLLLPLFLLLVFLLPTKQVRAGNQVSLVLVGDVMLGRLVNDALSRYSPAYFWGDTRGLLRRADLTLINQEFVITRSRKKWREGIKAFHYRADPAVIRLYRSAGIDYVSLANNHILDFGKEGLMENLKILNQHRVAHAGAGKNFTEAQKPAWLTVKGIKIAVISFTNNMPEWNAANKPGLFYLAINKKNTVPIKKLIAKAKKKGADYVIISAHWGPNWRARPYQDFIEFAHTVMDGGADLFHGHSAHVMNGIEIYQGKPIFYNMGDFIDDYAIDPIRRNDLSYIARVTLNPISRKFTKIELFPTVISHMQVNRAQGKDFDIVAHRLKKLSSEMRTKVEKKNRKLIISDHLVKQP